MLSELTGATVTEAHLRRLRLRLLLLPPGGGLVLSVALSLLSRKAARGA